MFKSVKFQSVISTLMEQVEDCTALAEEMLFFGDEDGYAVYESADMATQELADLGYEYE